MRSKSDRLQKKPLGNCRKHFLSSSLFISPSTDSPLPLALWCHKKGLFMEVNFIKEAVSFLLFFALCFRVKQNEKGQFVHDDKLVSFPFLFKNLFTQIFLAQNLPDSAIARLTAIGHNTFPMKNTTHI